MLKTPCYHFLNHGFLYGFLTLLSRNQLASSMAPHRGLWHMQRISAPFPTFLVSQKDVRSTKCTQNQWQLRCFLTSARHKNPTKMASVPHFRAGDTALTALEVHNYFLQEKRLCHWQWHHSKSHTKSAPPRIRRCQEAASQLPRKWSVQGSHPLLFQLTPAGTAYYCWVQLFVFNAVKLWVPFSKKGVRTRHKHTESTHKTLRGRTQCTLHNCKWRLLKPAKWKGLTLFRS